MIRRDTTAVVWVDMGSFVASWGEDDFVNTLQNRACIGIVAEIGETIVGFAVYELAKDSLIVLRMAVDYHYRRRGIGTEILARLKNKLSAQRRKYLVTLVPDTDTEDHLFLSANGFRAVKVLRSDEASERDLYKFRYTHGDGDCETQSTEQPAQV